MEIHQHSHADTHVKGKKWNVYFWEFFMMFAAISASFFVENQREHYVERKKENQYMRSMLADLKSDTAILVQKKDANNIMITGLGSLFTLVKNFQGDKKSLKELYQLFHDNTSWVRRARLADRTISQLKNSGNMRLIHIQAISDSLLVYDERKKLLVDQGEAYKRANDIITDLSAKMLDYTYLLPIDTLAISSGQNFNKELLLEFANDVKLLMDQIDTYVSTLKELLDHAINIIALIQKHYHLK